MNGTRLLFENGTPTGMAESGRAEPAHRILVADDDPEMHELYAALLSPRGYVVERAHDGAAAWEALCANSYDLLITDNSMPKVSGMELLQKVRLAQMTVPAIMVSGALPDGYSNLKLSAVLPKPFSPDELLENVEQVMRATYAAAPSNPTELIP